MNYRVEWVVDVEAATAIEAAKTARTLQMDKHSVLQVFKVSEPAGPADDRNHVHIVDLLAIKRK